MTRERWVLVVAWTPVVVTLGWLLGVFINANLGWPSSTIVGVAPFVVSLGGWYAIFMVFMWAFRWPRCELLPRAFIAMGWSVLLILLVAGVAVVFLGIPPPVKDVLYDPVFRVVEACDVSIRPDPVEEWRCDVRQWPQRHEDATVFGADFFDDGRIAVGLEFAGPLWRVKNGARYYRTAAVFRAEGDREASFTEHFHGCLGLSENEFPLKKFLVTRGRILYVEQTAEHDFTIREVVTDKGQATGPEGTREYARMLEAFGSRVVYIVHDELGRPRLLAVGGGRAGLFDPEGDLATLQRSFPRVATPRDARWLPFVVRGDDLLAPQDYCGDATTPGLCVFRSEGPVFQPLRTTVIPEGTAFPASSITQVAPVAVVSGAVLVVLDLKTPTGVFDSILALIRDDGELAFHPEIPAELYLNGPKQRHTRDRKLVLFDDHKVLIVDATTSGTWPTVSSRRTTPGETENTALKSFKNGRVKAVSTTGDILEIAEEGQLRVHSPGQPARSLSPR